MLRRFTRRVQQSGVLIHTRKLKFHTSKPTRRQIRESAIRRAALAREWVRLDKLGKLPKKDEKSPRRTG
jgi:ribosomal protein S21